MADDDEIVRIEEGGVVCIIHPAFTLANQHTFSFVTAQKLPKAVFLGWTIVWGIFNFTNLFLEFFYFGEADSKGKLWFIYIENWAFFLVVLFAVVDCVVTVSAFTLNKKLMNEDNEHIPWYMALQRVLYRLSTTCCLAVCIVYFIFQKDTSLHAILKVAIPGCYMFLNLFISAKPYLYSSVYIPIVFMITYTIFSVVYQTQGGGPIYDLILLDWEKYPYIAAGIACGIILVGIPLFDSIVYLFYAFVTLNCCRKPYVAPETELIVADPSQQEIRREPSTVYNIMVINESNRGSSDRSLEPRNPPFRLPPINAASNIVETEISKDGKPKARRKKNVSQTLPPPIHSDDSEGDGKIDETEEEGNQTPGNNSLTGRKGKPQSPSNDNDDTQTENSDTSKYADDNDKENINSSHYKNGDDKDEESTNSKQRKNNENKE